MFPLAVILGIAAFREDARVWLYAGPLASVGLLIAAYVAKTYLIKPAGLLPASPFVACSEV